MVMFGPVISYLLMMYDFMIFLFTNSSDSILPTPVHLLGPDGSH